MTDDFAKEQRIRCASRIRADGDHLKEIFYN